MDAAELRSRFPVCDRLTYLNAGTDGPLPATAAAAAHEAIDGQVDGGRWRPHFEARIDALARLRECYAGVLRTDVANIALTTSTSEGLGKVLAGMDLGPHDEILTSDQEHPGLIGPLLAAREFGVKIRVGPLARLSEAVEETTTVIACSHVGWADGTIADPALGSTGLPLVLDGAQGVGAIDVDVEALGCAAYAGAGQKWLCGADGTGLLYVAPEWTERIRSIGPAYFAFAEANKGLDSTLHEDARRHDTASLPREGVAMSIAAAETLGAYGWDRVHARAIELAQTLVDRLRDSGRTVAPRDATTLVAWEDAEPAETRMRLAEAGVIIRDLPGTSYLRASVGAWNDESDLDRLLEHL
jgi:selenocysteine lyase/cysteine desulfurase